MKRLIIIFGILLLFVANIAFAAPVGKVTYVEGRVDVLKPGKTVATTVSKGDPVDVGDIYRAKSNSKAEIIFDNKNTLRIVQNTRVEIKEYTIDPEQNIGVFKLYRGKVMAIAPEEFVKKVAAFAEKNRLEIHTPNAVAGVRGTIFFVSYEGGITWVLCIEGKVYVFNLAHPGIITVIPVNFISNVTGDNPPTTPAGLGKEFFETYIMPWVMRELEKEEEIYIDTTSPVLTLTSSAQPGAGVGLSNLNFTISSNESATFSYKFDGGEWTSTLGTVSLLGIAEGNHTFEYKGTDPEGNTSTYSLSFNLTRYTLTGAAHNNASFDMSADVSGDVASVYNKDWGGYRSSLYSGTYGTEPSGSFEIVAGGTNDPGDGYWLSRMDMNASGGVLSGTSSLNHLTYTTLGLGIGTVSGTYGESWDATDEGQYITLPLTFVSEISANLFYYGGGIPVADGSLSPSLLGGSQSLWTATQTSPAPVTMIGEYTPGETSDGHTWATEFYSYNYLNSTKTTYDGGAYRGFVGGRKYTSESKDLDAIFRAIAVGPSSQACYLIGSLNGEAYPDINMFGMNGTVYSVQIFDSITGINPNNLYDSIQTTGYGLSGDGYFEAGGSIDVNNSYSSKQKLYTPNHELAIWKSMIFGSYSASVSPTWYLRTASETTTYLSGTWTEGTQWSNGVLGGPTFGYAADWDRAQTWIGVGETIGTYKETGDSGVWQAVQLGLYLNTNQFLAMRQTSDGLAKLQQLNIPCVEIGRTNLTGSYSYMGNSINVNLYDTIFLGFNNGQRPQTWVTGNVSGTYGGNPTGASVDLTSNVSGLTGNFYVNKWESNKWLSSISGNALNGIGSHSGAFSYRGAGAGTYTTGPASGTFAGTAAGVATPR
jgi:hypothetical protein